MENEKKLKRCLERLYQTFDLARLSPDPLEFVHKFRTRKDREIAGLIASSLAYGRVAGIKQSIERVMDAFDWKPYDFTANFNPKKDRKIFKGFVHRFNDDKDIAALIYFARQMIESSGSIGGFFTEGYSKVAPNIKEALSSFSERVLKLDTGGIYGAKKLPKRAGVRYFFPSPTGGSACKRLNLYLRWMVRRGDELDFGLWRSIDPAKLIIPLDTHIARISRNIGLTGRRSADWKTAEEITERLKKLDPADPVKYDFSLCRLGILEMCPTHLDPALCEDCLLREICVL